MEASLLGKITPNLRKVGIDFGNDFIFLNFYYNEAISELEKKLADAAGVQVFSDFSSVQLKNKIIKKIHYPFPKLLPHIGLTAFRRYEHIPEESEEEIVS